jgi:hypothetical protein
MAAFDPNVQFGPTPFGAAGLMRECGRIVLASADDSGETFTIATKLGRIKGGFAVLSDGSQAYVEEEVCTSGQATFYACGTRSGSNPVVNYELWGT